MCSKGGVPVEAGCPAHGRPTTCLAGAARNHWLTTNAVKLRTWLPCYENGVDVVSGALDEIGLGPAVAGNSCKCKD